MDIVFVVPERSFSEFHGLYALSASLKREGIPHGAIVDNNYRNVLSRIREIRPKYVGFSLLWGTHYTAIKWAKMLKQALGVKVIAGGVAVTYAGSYLPNDVFDTLFYGDSDQTLPEYLKRGGEVEGLLGCSQIQPNLAPVVDDLDTLPFPAREIIYDQDPYLGKQYHKMFLAGRGCPFKCTYCYAGLSRRRPRRKSVNYLIEEILATKAKYPLKYIIFQDDTFAIFKSWLEEFSRIYKKKVNLPFSCWFRPGILDKDIVKMLSEAGCIAGMWSIESGNEMIRNKLLARNVSEKQILDTSELLNKAGIRTFVGNMVGLPGETRENMLETLELNIRAKTFYSIAHLYTPYPGSPLTDYAIENSMLDEQRIYDIGKDTQNYSVLCFSEADQRWIYKFKRLFSLLVRYPFLIKYQKYLFKLPNLILARIDDLINVVMNYRIYRLPKFVNFSLLMRYLKQIRLEVHPNDAPEEKKLV